MVPRTGRRSFAVLISSRRAGNGANGSANGSGHKSGDDDTGGVTTTTVATTPTPSPSPTSSPNPDHLGSQPATLSAPVTAAVTLSVVAASVTVAIVALLIHWRYQRRRQRGAYPVPRPSLDGPDGAFPWDQVQGYTTIGIEVIDPSLLRTEYDRLLDEIKGGSLLLDEKPYVAPHQHPLELSSQLKEHRVKRIRRNDIILQDMIHSGRLGPVHRAQWQNYTDPLAVAVKVLKQDGSHDDKISFFREAVALGQLTHPNIVRLFGLVNDGGQVMMVLESLSRGNLKAHLATLRPDPGELCPLHIPEALLQLCHQVTLGMHFLSSKGFVHCDLAAMSILVSGGGICKVAHLGASLDHIRARDTPPSEAPAVRLWEAPEVVSGRSYSTPGDVWSFGNVLYEVWSMGQELFGEEEDITEVPGRINRGYRLAPPPGCPTSIYGLMIQCWNPDAPSRPQFSDVLDFLFFQNKAVLLKVPTSDQLLSHPLAGILGGPLSAGVHLYPDLQRTYELDQRGYQ